MHVSEIELKEFIIDSGLLSKKDIDAAVEEAKAREQSLGDIILAQGLLHEDSLRRVQAYVLGIPFINLKEYDLSVDALSIIPEPISRTHNIIAYKKEGGKDNERIEVAMLDIADLAAIDFLRTENNIGNNIENNIKILPRLTDTDSIKHALNKYHKSLKANFGDVVLAESLKVDDVSSAARVVDKLFQHAIMQGASDIHIEPMEAEVLVRYRINGVLYDAVVLPQGIAARITDRIKALANLKLDEKTLPQDGRFKMETSSDRLSFRVSIIPTVFGEKVVMRLSRKTNKGFTLETLGFHGEGLERIHQALTKTSGIILITGPAKSGKTTTLYTMLDILNHPRVNISTIEDPIEYQMKRINQTQVAPKIGLTFANGMRAIMRQDPDIIMIDDIRDEETASLAVNAALSGRVVIAAMTANSATEAITRLADMVQSSLLESVVSVVIGQRLAHKLDATTNNNERNETYKMNAEMRVKIAPEKEFHTAFKMLQDERLIGNGISLDDLLFYKSNTELKREEKDDKDSKSYIGIQEVLTVSDMIKDTGKDIIKERATSLTASLLGDGIYKAIRGFTSVEEILRAVNNK